MIIDNKIQQIINEALIADNQARNAEHVSSGLLSASMLYQPLRFQVMKTIGVPTKQPDPYVLGKFKRGNDVEDWYIGMLERAGVLIEKQKEVKYKNVIGFIDAYIDPSSLNFKEAKIHEVKSVTNAKLKQIANTEIDYHYRLQATLYALALGEMYYAIDIVSAEDLRVNTYIFDIKETQKDVDEIIARYDQAMKDWKSYGALPVFETHPKVAWTSNFEYAPFSVEHCEMGDEDIIRLVTGEYGDEFSRFPDGVVEED